MRTTLTLDDDVAAKLKAELRRAGRSFRDVVNETLRRGLASQRATSRRRDFLPARAARRWHHRTRRTALGHSARSGARRADDRAADHGRRPRGHCDRARRHTLHHRPRFLAISGDLVGKPTHGRRLTPEIRLPPRPPAASLASPVCRDDLPGQTAPPRTTLGAIQPVTRPAASSSGSPGCSATSEPAPRSHSRPSASSSSRSY